MITGVVAVAAGGKREAEPADPGGTATAEE